MQLTAPIAVALVSATASVLAAWISRPKLPKPKPRRKRRERKPDPPNN